MTQGTYGSYYTNNWKRKLPNYNVVWDICQASLESPEYIVPISKTGCDQRICLTVYDKSPTFPDSKTLVSMMITSVFSCQIINQKSSIVRSWGPCVAMNLFVGMYVCKINYIFHFKWGVLIIWLNRKIYQNCKCCYFDFAPTKYKK